jgi:hypothetical protein
MLSAIIVECVATGRALSNNPRTIGTISFFLSYYN